MRKSVTQNLKEKLMSQRRSNFGAEKNEKLRKKVFQIINTQIIFHFERKVPKKKTENI